MKRRHFIQATTGTVAGFSLAGPVFGGIQEEQIKLGIDGYSTRGFRWNAIQLLDYAVSVRADVVEASFRREFESLEDDHLKKVREHADRTGVEIVPGLGSICSLSKVYYERSQGTPTEHLLLGIRMAKNLGATVVKCYLGGSSDRIDTVPMQAKMEKTVEALKSVRSQALDSGVRFALETHGDLLAREMKTIIEEAGPDIAGCCLDTGNPVRLGEDPLMTLEILGPYTITTHIRDSVVYEHPRGAAYQWVALGDGTIDFKRFVALFRKLCPQAPFLMETLTGSPPRVIPFLEPDYWVAFPGMPAADFARFLELVRNGHPFTGSMMISYGDDQPPEYEAAILEQQRFDMERSLEYAKKTLDVGVNWRKG